MKPIIETCDNGHKFAKLPDHPKKDGLSRCPHCLVIGLDECRQRQKTRPQETIVRCEDKEAQKWEDQREAMFNAWKRKQNKEK